MRVNPLGGGYFVDDAELQISTRNFRSDTMRFQFLFKSMRQVVAKGTIEYDLTTLTNLGCEPEKVAMRQMFEVERAINNGDHDLRCHVDVATDESQGTSSLSAKELYDFATKTASVPKADVF